MDLPLSQYDPRSYMSRLAKQYFIASFTFCVAHHIPPLSPLPLIGLWAAGSMRKFDIENLCDFFPW